MAEAREDPLAALRRPSAPEPGSEEYQRKKDRDDASFNKRVSVQQMLNQVSPILRAFAAGGTPAVEVVEGSSIRDYVEMSLRLAVSVASRITDTLPENVDPQMVRAIRPSMAEFVAERSRAKIPVDIARDTDAIVDAIGAVDPKFDINPFDSEGVSYETTLKMTAVAAVTGILCELTTYGFRQDVPKAAARLVDALMRKTAAMVIQVMGDDDNVRNRTGLMQSWCKHNGDLMRNSIVSQGKEVFRIMRTLMPQQQAEWFRTHDPIGEAIQVFEGHGSVAGGFALTAISAIKDPSAAFSSGPESP